MIAKQLIVYRNLLTENRNELMGVLLKHGDWIRNGADRFADSIDQSTQASEAALEARVRQNHSGALKAIDTALGRIDRGTFGQCEIWSEAVLLARLNAVPWARLCRDYKNQQDTEVSNGTSG